jgi:hypothetical protein
MHPCPVRHCREFEVPDNHIMCRRHWMMLPLAMQAEVIAAFATWRRWQNSNSALTAYHWRVRGAYVAARQAAIDYVNERAEARS